MKLYSENENYKLYHGNMLDMADVIKPNTIDAIICDPPYELNFMNRSWDNSGIAFNVDAWKKCYDALKPGGFLLAFGGSRTFHRIAVAIEDAGFYIKDVIMYVYGSAMPKGLNIGLAIDKYNGVESKVVSYEDCPDFKDVGNKQKEMGNQAQFTFGQIEDAERLQYARKVAQNEWNGWNTQIKPAYEPIIIAQKPIENNYVYNILKWGVGAYNVDECRIELESTYEYKEVKNRRKPLNDDAIFNDKTCGFKAENRIMQSASPEGRYPANFIHDGSEEATKDMPNTKSAGSDYNFEKSNQDNPTHLYTNIKSGKHFEDEGSASRYFYCAKASKFDRDEGLDDFEEKKKYVDFGTRKDDGKSVFEGSDVLAKNIHPTCKPTNLMRYLVRLVSPKGATILDCFNGSGSTGKAVMLENKEFEKDYKYIGIELTDEYLPIAKARIEYICNNEFEFEKSDNKISNHKVIKNDKDQMTIFDFEN